MNIKKYKQTDKKRVLEMFRQNKEMFSKHNIKELDENDLNNESTIDYLKFSITTNNEVVGFIAIKNDTDSFGRWEIKWLVIDEKMKRRGIGTKLITFAEQKVKDFSGKAMYLSTLSSKHEVSQVAMNFYQKCGYKEVGFFKDYWGIGCSKILYQKILD